MPTLRHCGFTVTGDGEDRKGEYVEDPGLTEQCTRRFTSLREMALGIGESLELVAEAAAEL